MLGAYVLGVCSKGKYLCLSTVELAEKGDYRRLRTGHCLRRVNVCRLSTRSRLREEMLGVKYWELA